MASVRFRGLNYSLKSLVIHRRLWKKLKQRETEIEPEMVGDGALTRETIKVMSYNLFCLFREIICLVQLGLRENLL